MTRIGRGKGKGTAIVSRHVPSGSVDKRNLNKRARTSANRRCRRILLLFLLLLLLLLLLFLFLLRRRRRRSTINHRGRAEEGGKRHKF